MIAWSVVVLVLLGACTGLFVLMTVGALVNIAKAVTNIVTQLDALVYATRASVLVADRNAKTSERMADVICRPAGPLVATPSGVVTPLMEPSDTKGMKH